MKNTAEQTQKRVLWARVGADILTMTRVIGGLSLALWPWAKVINPLGEILKWNIVLWSTDIADGILARRSRTAPSRLGQGEIWVDMQVAVATSIALIRNGFMPAWCFILWVVFCLLLFLLKPHPTTQMTFIFPQVLMPPLLGIIYGVKEVVFFLLWLVFMAYLGRVRLRFVIKNFIQGLPPEVQRWVYNWLPAWFTLTEAEELLYIENPAAQVSINEDRV